MQIKELNYTSPEETGLYSRVSFVLSDKNIGWNKRKNELLNKFNNNISFIEGLGALSVIGEGLNRDNTILQSSIELLKSNSINIFGITTTSFRISVLIEQNYLMKSLILFHEKWIIQRDASGEKQIEYPTNI
jgi:aspartokinase